MLSRRTLSAGTGIVGCFALFRAVQSDAAPLVPDHFDVTHSDGRWRKLPTSDQYAVFHLSDAGRPHSGALLNEHDRGTVSCVDCDQAAFSPTTRYDGHTALPSIWAPVENGVGTSKHTSFRIIRTAVHCSCCGRHPGLVFNDDPEPSGPRS